MNLLSWNCRRLGNQTTVEVLSNLVMEKAPKILFLMEKKLSVVEMRKVQKDLPYRCMVVVPSVHRSGGLALLWMEEVELHVQTYSPNHIDSLIHFGDIPASMGGLRCKGNTSHGLYSNISTLGVQHHGCAVETSMRF